MAARDQLEAELALAEPRFAGQQDAEAEDVHEHAVPRRPLGEVLRQVAADHVDHVPRGLLGDEKRDVGAVAEGDQAIRRHLPVGADQHRRVEGDDAGDAALGDICRLGIQVGDLAPADDLDPVRVDVVEVADQIGGRAGFSHRRFVEVPLGVGVAGDPLPVERRPEFLEQRLGADDRGLHRQQPRRERAGRAATWLKRPISAVPTPR
jgi:hypothetical protein